VLRYLFLFLCRVLSPARQASRSGGKKINKPASELHRRLQQARWVRVCHLWISALVSVVLFPAPAFGIAVVLFTTFLSFSVLDESG